MEERKNIEKKKHGMNSRCAYHLMTTRYVVLNFLFLEGNKDILIK